MMTAEELADYMVNRVAEDLQIKEGDRLAVLVNGLGSTPLEELYILNAQVAEKLDQLGVTTVKTFVGEYVTSMEMAGASLSIMKLNEELEQLLAEPARTPFVVVGG